MKQFSGFEAKKSAGARELLPAGGYGLVPQMANYGAVCTGYGSYDWSRLYG